MREIKFRIWWPNEDGNGGRMIDNPYWEFKKLNDGFRDMTDWVFMQFTGLLDKNGKEIYEGDIVKHHYKTGESSEPYQVRDIYWFREVLSHFKNDPYKLEIIGNIYENPELIK